MSRSFICNYNYPVAETSAGKLRGFKLDSTYIFKGVKYAQAKRFMQPEPVKPWSGIKEAVEYGYVCPLLDPESPMGDLLIPHRFWPKSEDCLSLNLWTQSLDVNAKKPVMVWLHGGGFSTGSSIEMVAYDGENLSRYGDVVVVSINHRLNILGYCDLSAYGDKYWNSGNAGQADIVAALKWIKENIAAFGGDPDNVTLFGQSGGGAKINSLMQTPAAKGLFHKGILMSGVGGRRPAMQDNSKEVIEALLMELGTDNIEVLEALPFDKLSAAYSEAAKKLQAKGIRAWWAPKANDWYLGDPYEIGFTDFAKTVPVMVGSVISEWGFAPAPEGKNEMSADNKRKLIAKQFGEDYADELIRLFKAAYPDKNELDLLSISNRLGTLEYTAEKAKQSSAPAYNYLFTFSFPYDGGKPAWHCSDIPFVFKNTDKVAICNLHGVSDALENAVSGAYLAFAKTGDPNGEGLALWPAYKVEKPATLFFDVECEASYKDKELMELHNKVAPKGMFF